MQYDIPIVGAEYGGAQAAIVLRQRKFAETIGIVGEGLSRFYEAEHRSHGVDLRLSALITGIEGIDGRAVGVQLNDRAFVRAEMAIVGIGIIPAVEPLLAAGAEGENGVAVDDQGRTSLPDVWAIGNCALHANAFAQGLPVRLESVQNANDMAMTIARAIMGEPAGYHAVPWFRSNQYDPNLQMIGLSAGNDAEILRGELATRSFPVVYPGQGRVVASDSVNAVKAYVQGRALILKGAIVASHRLADASISLNDLKSVGVERAGSSA